MIGIDGHVLGDKSGGNETYYRNLIENLDKDLQKEIILFVNKEADISALDFRGKVVRFKSHNAFVRNFIEMPYLAWKYKLKCLHMQYFIPFVRPCPVVATIHDISFEHFDDIFTKKEMFIQKKLIPYAARKSKKVLTVSEFSKKDICECYGCDPDKVVVTYNGKSSAFKKFELSEEQRNTLREKFGLPEEYILYVGNIQPRKNLKRLLQAYVKYAVQDKNAKPLVIVGKKAWMYDSIFEEIKQNHLEDRVYFTGYVEEVDLVRLYNDALFFIYPSIFEGFGLPVLEAMACGTPVITSDITSIPEVAGDACYMVNPFEVDEIYKALELFAGNDELRQEYGRKGLEQAGKFDWKITAKQTEKVYKELCKAGK